MCGDGLFNLAVVDLEKQLAKSLGTKRVQVLKRRPAVSLPQKILSNTFTTAQEKPKTDESSQQDAYGDQTDVDEKRHEILEAALAHVSQHGWSIQALAAGAKTVGYPGVAHGMFPRGGAELVLFFEEQCNAKHETVLAETVKERMDRKAFMCTAIEKRLRMIIPYIKNWSQAQAILATPENAPAAMAVLAELVDNIWYHAGDRSADFNWYLKRASLGVAYKATELCMLQDSSSDFKDTWQFLERRIENLQTFGGVVRQLQGITPVCAGAFITVRNILGMANQRR